MKTQLYQIYCLYDSDNIPFYIGLTKSPYNRFIAHRADYGKGIAMRPLIEGILTREDGYIKEREMINGYLSKGIKLKNKQVLSVEPRVGKTYKIADSVYKKCMEKAEKEGTTVANLLEDYLYDYAE